MPDTVDYASFTFKIDGLSSATYVARFEGTEAVSELFQLEILLTSEDREIRLADVVGKSATLTIQPVEGEPRHVNGLVCRFRHVEDGKNVSIYHATLVPKLWRLRHRQDSRIFQELAVPDILEKVLMGAGLSGEDYRLALSGAHPAREYCVQYRESDFAFLSRLMEEEGIFYFFEHTDSGHVLVMADAKDVPTPIAAPSSVTFRAALGAMARSESVSRFSCTEEVQIGKVTLGDFNFKKPSLSLLQTKAASLDTDLEAYDFPGEYDVPGDGATLSRVRLEEQQARRIVADGESGCIRFTPGYRFTLTDGPREDENREYLITRVHHKGTQPQMGEAATGGSMGYSNTFQCIPSDVPYRPERRTPRPTIKGVQTAIVTGPGGEEVHTDEHGRVKVHFHWDRVGGMDEKSSCWIRVSQIWAGAGYGAMWIPRIGHEVVVDFIEGDPDRPIIVGRVYHGANVPPYPLPAEKTKSTIKSDSSKGGGGSNELRFEDKKGQEEIFLHGQKDWNIKIEHDENELVGHDETLEVGHDRARKVGNDETVLVEHDRTKTVKHDQRVLIGHDESIEIGNDRAMKVGKDESVVIGANATRDVGGDEVVSIGGDSTTTVGGDASDSIDGSRELAVKGGSSETIDGDGSISVGKNSSLTVGGNHTVSVAKKMSVAVTKDAEETVDGEKKVTVAKKLVMTVGSGSVTIEKNGNITVVGKDITIKGDGKINVQGSSKVIVKSSGPVDVEASGKVKIKGSAVDMN